MLLEIKGLSVSFKNNGGVRRVVDGVDLDVGHNEVVGLIGESGSGKTMTALSIMRLIPPLGKIDGGRILFDGQDLLGLSEEAIRKIRGKFISMIFQEPFTSLNPVMRVGDQITEAVITHTNVGTQEAKNQTMLLLDKIQIDKPWKIYDDYPHQLSGGERQRVMIAMALALGPSLLIADEPTTALDVTIQSEILKLLLRLKREFGMSVLFITHDFGVVNEVADRIFVMKEGAIVESGKKDEILRKPKKAYTKQLMEAVPRIDSERAETRQPRQILLSVESVSKTFPIERGFLMEQAGTVTAVDNVTLQVNRGTTLGLVGESGSGKTTLGKLILGLLRPDKGKISIEGKELTASLWKKPREIRRMMQIVFQDPYGSLDPHMRMGDIVLEGPSILRKNQDERERILKDVLAKANLSYDDRHKYPHQFSGGERQRISIARALAVDPQFLVLDEPVSSLDVSIQGEILNLLKMLQKVYHLTYLFISHDLRVVGSIADEVAVMYHGKIVECAPVGRIFTHPEHLYTQKLLSSIPSLGSP